MRRAQGVTWSRAMGWSLGLTQMVNGPIMMCRLVPGSTIPGPLQQQRFFLTIASEQENKG